MTSKEFIIWLKGFITACNDYAPTPKQWDTIKDELEKVNDYPQSYGTITISNPNIASFTTTNTHQPFTTQDDESLKPISKKRKQKSVQDWEDEFDLGGGE